MKATYTLAPGTTHFLKRQRGASLLEGIAYLGIAAIVLLGAVSLLSNAFTSAKSNQTIEELISLRTSVKKLYAGQPLGASTDLRPTLIAAQSAPTTLVIDATNGTLTNSWGGNVTVAANAAGTQFLITYPSVPQNVCISVVSGATGWVSVANSVPTTISTFPITPTQAGTLCPATTNTLTFTST